MQIKQKSNLKFRLPLFALVDAAFKASEWWKLVQIVGAVLAFHPSIHIIELKSKAVISFQTVAILPIKYDKQLKQYPWVHTAKESRKWAWWKKSFENHHNWLAWTCCMLNDKDIEFGHAFLALLSLKCKLTSILYESIILLWYKFHLHLSVWLDSFTLILIFDSSIQTVKYYEHVKAFKRSRQLQIGFVGMSIWKESFKTIPKSIQLRFYEVNARCNSNTSNEVIAVISNLNGNPKWTKRFSLQSRNTCAGY